MENQQKLSGKRVVLVIAPNNFRDEEYAGPKKILADAGAAVIIASAQAGTAKGSLGLEAKVDIAVEEIKLEDFNGIVFIGGAGCRVFWEDPKSRALIQQFYQAGKLVGGICSAAVILAKAGILKEKRATVWEGEAEHLIKAGAIYKGNPVEIDSNIITGNGPGAAKDFGQALVAFLKGK